MTGLEDFIAGLPKVELHVHQVGSAPPRVVAALAKQYGSTVVPHDEAHVVDYFRFRDFNHFVEIYLSVVDLVRTPEDLRLTTYEAAADLARQQVRYAEVTCTPYISETAGISGAEFVAAIEDARIAAEEDHGIVLRWIFDIPSLFGAAAAESTLQVALDHGPAALVGFGLGGPEIGWPREFFAPWFARARAAGLHSVPHAGETGGPDFVRAAIHDLGAERIEHGIAAADDLDLLRTLAETAIALDVCPTSNVALGAVPNLGAHPLRRLVDAGVTVTINSDDPPMFGTTLNNEYAVAASLLDLDESGLADLARAGVRASFAAEELKGQILGEIAAYVAAR